MMKIITIFLALSLFVFPVSAWAQTNSKQNNAGSTFRINQPTGYGVQIDGTADNIIGVLVKNAIILIFSFSALGVIAYFLWGAFDWIVSGGDKEKINSARKKMTHALFGLAILSLSFVIITVAGEIVGFNPLKELLFPALGDQSSTVTP